MYSYTVFFIIAVLLPRNIYAGAHREGEYNIALHKPTNSSTPLIEEDTDIINDSSKAVDGNLNTTMFHSTEHDDDQMSAWWMVDFQSIATISEIVIYNRLDCCKDRLRGAKVEIIGTDSVTVVTYGTVTAEEPDTVTFAFPNAVGRYVKITSDSILHFHQIEVYGTTNIDGLGNIADPLSVDANLTIYSNGAIPGYEPELALDLNYDTTYHSSDDNAWWLLDLNSINFVRQVTIFNRRDCCKARIHNALISVLDNNKLVIDQQRITYQQLPLFEGNEVLIFDFPDYPQGRYIEISLAGNYLNFNEVRVYGSIALLGLSTNIAFQKPTSSSEVVEGMESDKAVDCNLNTRFHTFTPEGENFWMVDFESINYVRHIVIYNRNDCCQSRLNGAVVSILDSDQNVVVDHVINLAQHVNENIIMINFLHDPVGRYVKIHSPDNVFLHFREVVVYGDISLKGLANLALNRPTTQSNTMNPNEDASKAVDGDAGTHTHTNLPTDAWWKVDLESDDAIIRQIRITNREGCCKERLRNAVLSVLDKDGHVIFTSFREDTGHLHDLSQDVVNFNFPDIRGARVIEVSLQGDYLSLGQVEVYGRFEITPDYYYNLANGRPAAQTYNLPGHEASMAVDGNVDTIIHTDNPSHINNYVNGDNKWEVDLQATALIRQIIIINRKNCCKERLQGTEIRILNEQGEILTSNVIEDVAPPFVKINYADAPGRYVQLIQDHTYLHVAEVEVLGKYMTASSSSDETARANDFPNLPTATSSLVYAAATDPPIPDTSVVYAVEPLPLVPAEEIVTIQTEPPVAAKETVSVVATELPVVDPTATPTSAPTSAPTDAPTSAPTDAPTGSPTDPPTTAAPTPPPTDPCEPCGNTPTPSMTSNGQGCTTVSDAELKCTDKKYWRKKNYCELSCFNKGKGYGKTCCASS